MYLYCVFSAHYNRSMFIGTGEAFAEEAGDRLQQG